MKGFGNQKVPRVTLNLDEINKIVKEYKDTKKYMKSSLFAIKRMDGTETRIKKLLEENQDS